MNVTHVPPFGLFFRMARCGRRMFHVRMYHRGHGLTTRMQHVAPRAGALALALLSLVGLSGCHFSRPSDRPASFLDNAQFMEAWKTYLHCGSSTEPAEIRVDLQRLNQVYGIPAEPLLRTSAACCHAFSDCHTTVQGRG